MTKQYERFDTNDVINQLVLKQKKGQIFKMNRNQILDYDILADDKYKVYFKGGYHTVLNLDEQNFNKLKATLE